MSEAEVTPRFKIERVRSRSHLDRLKTLPCSITGCKRQPVDPHHLKCSPEGGGSVVAGDNWAVPLCRYGHHDAAAPDGVHRTGNEVAWWVRHGLNPLAIARHHAEVSRALGLLP